MQTPWKVKSLEIFFSFYFKKFLLSAFHRDFFVLTSEYPRPFFKYNVGLFKNQEKNRTILKRRKREIDDCMRYPTSPTEIIRFYQHLKNSVLVEEAFGGILRLREYGKTLFYPV